MGQAHIISTSHIGLEADRVYKLMFLLYATTPILKLNLLVRIIRTRSREAKSIPTPPCTYPSLFINSLMIQCENYVVVYDKLS